MAGADAREESVVDKVGGVECVQNLDLLLFGQIDQILIMVDQFALLLLQKSEKYPVSENGGRQS